MNGSERVIRVALLLFLAAAAFRDLRCGTVRLYRLGLSFALAVLLRALTGLWNLPDMAAGTLVGFCLLLLGFAANEAIGYGDGLLLTVTGILLGWKYNILLFFFALIICAVCCTFLLLTGKRKAKDRIVFAPFLLGGYLLLMLV